MPPKRESKKVNKSNVVNEESGITLDNILNPNNNDNENVNVNEGIKPKKIALKKKKNSNIVNETNSISSIELDVIANTNLGSVIEQVSIKKKKTNKIIFEKSASEIANTLNDENFKKKFLDFLNKMHNLLRGCAVTGDPALDDILNTLFLCYIEDRISDKGNFDFENSDKECYETISSKIKEYSKYLKVSYLLEHIEEFKKNENGMNSIAKCGKIFKLHPTTKLLFKDDNFINCPDPVIFSKLLRECKEFSKEQNIFENIDIAGIAYEYMTTKHAGNGGMSKEMGQYFTERPLMWILFQLFDLKDINDLGIDKNSTIGDEFCATFGFPLMARKFLKEKFNIDIEEKNMYGVEYHERLSRFAIMNAMFSMSNFENITRGDSFITNVTHHLDLSIHNVPFGKSMIPENIKATYNKFLEENPNKGYPELKDYIPFCNKKIDAILASQVVLYKTKKMGIMIIKDGEETSGKTTADYRKWFSENCIIKKIIKIPCDSFTCTKTKTICIYFIKKEGKMTETIQLLELIDNGNKISEVCNVSMDDLKKNNYSWDPNTYVLDEEMEKIMNKSKCEWKKLGDNINFLQKSKRNAKYGNDIGTYPFFKSSNTISAYVDIPDYNEESIIIGDGGKPNINYGVKFSASDHCIIFNTNNNLLINKWIYYYIKINLNILEKYYTGAGIENISKDDIKSIMIPIPSIEIQNEIVKMLDDLSHQKQLLTDRKNGIKIQIEYYFKNQIKKNKDTIKIVKLEKLTNIDIGSTPSTINDDYWVNGNHIWLSISELKNNLIPITNSKKKLTEKAIQECNLTLVKSGTILMSFKLSIGKLGIAGCNLYTNEAILHINTNSDELNRYLYYHILSISINNTATGSMGEAGSLNKDKLKVLDMFIQTDKIKQKEIVDYLDKLENKKNSIDDELKDIDNLIKNILEQSYI
jgi:type I restriction enzyme S subunit